MQSTPNKRRTIYDGPSYSQSWIFLSIIIEKKVHGHKKDWWFLGWVIKKCLNLLYFFSAVYFLNFDIQNIFIGSSSFRLESWKVVKIVINIYLVNISSSWNFNVNSYSKVGNFYLFCMIYKIGNLRSNFLKINRIN